MLLGNRFRWHAKQKGQLPPSFPNRHLLVGALAWGRRLPSPAQSVDRLSAARRSA